MLFTLTTCWLLLEKAAVHPVGTVNDTGMETLDLLCVPLGVLRTAPLQTLGVVGGAWQALIVTATGFVSLPLVAVMVVVPAAIGVTVTEAPLEGEEVLSDVIELSQPESSICWFEVVVKGSGPVAVQPVPPNWNVSELGLTLKFACGA